MTFEQDWMDETLEHLEKTVWPPLDPNEESYLIRTCFTLRKKPLTDFTVEDLRIMIGQNMGLDYLVPMAIGVLQENILAEGELYEGDLLKMVLTSHEAYWKKEKENWRLVCQLFEAKEETLKNVDTTWDIKKGWLKSYESFKAIH